MSGDAFHSYLRSFFPFQPPDEVAHVTVTLSLKPGDVIFVHSFHDHGWADGTRLDSGERGWLPTTYCRPYNPPAMKYLLDALEGFWDIARNLESNANLDIFRSQSYVHGFLSGVKFLLSESNCLVRTSYLVQRFETVRKGRRSLLTSVSELMKLCRALQDECMKFDPGVISLSAIEEPLERALSKAYATVMRGVKFLDVWNDAVSEEEDDDEMEAPILDEHDDSDVQSKADTASPSPPPPSEPTQVADDKPLTSDSPSSLITPQPARTGASNRVSSNVSHTASSPWGQTLATHHLSASYHKLLNVLGNFIGYHIQFCPASELIDTTHQSLEACNVLISVVERIWEQDISRPRDLENGRLALAEQIYQLVNATRDAVQPSTSSPVIEGLSPLEDSLFVTSSAANDIRIAATDCVKAAGDCFAVSKGVLERTGDFEIDEMDALDENVETSKSSFTVDSNRNSADGLAIHTLPDQGSTGPASSAPKDAPESSTGAAASRPGQSNGLVTPNSSGSSKDEDAEAALLERSYAHELRWKDGKIHDATLRALIEKLTAHEAPPDTQFVATIYLTFRCFTNCIDLTNTFIDRYCSIGDSSPPYIAKPVRLRVYNFLNRWLESHWRDEQDHDALDLIRKFAQDKLIHDIPNAGRRILELCDKVTALKGPALPKSIPGGARRSGGQQSSENGDSSDGGGGESTDPPPPTPAISRGQLQMLRQLDKPPKNGINVSDFEPIEIARQITLKMSRIFCSIDPQELMEWAKKTGSPRAVNVRAMSSLFNDISALVTESILLFPETRKRANVLKHWIKIGEKCLELNNYDTLNAIVCSLNSSTISRLKRTWEFLNVRYRQSFAKLARIVDHQRNYSILRVRLRNCPAPCLPFLGIYLTDLTFVQHGNPDTRRIPISTEEAAAKKKEAEERAKEEESKTEQENGAAPVESDDANGDAAKETVDKPDDQGEDEGKKDKDTTNGDKKEEEEGDKEEEVPTLEYINFDKHSKTARIIHEVQRFQMPYHLVEVSEMQNWMHMHLSIVRNQDERGSMTKNYRRSLMLEPREMPSSAQNAAIANGASGDHSWEQNDAQKSSSSSNKLSSSLESAKDKLDFLSWNTKKKSVVD